MSQSLLMKTYINRYDTTTIELAMAVYWYLTHNHTGQDSNAYEALCKISKVYTPGMVERGPESDSVAEMIYNDLDMADAIVLAYDIRGYTKPGERVR